MSAELIYGIDFRTKDRRREQRLEAMAIEIMNQCFPAQPDDHMVFDATTNKWNWNDYDPRKGA